MSPIIEQPGKTSPHNEQGHDHDAPVQKMLIDLVELVPASSSAWFMTSYISQLNPISRPPDSAWLKPFRVDPPPLTSQLMQMGACVVFGCSTASFLHRRRRRDPNQPFIFAACVSIGAMAGGFTGASTEYIMLVHVSWAVCLAMLASAVTLRIPGCGHPRSSGANRVHYNPHWTVSVNKYTFD